MESTIIFKDRCKVGLYTKLLIRVYEAWKDSPGKKDSPLKYDLLRQKACRCFSLKKQEVMEIMRIFEELGYVSFEKRGIKLHYKVV